MSLNWHTLRVGAEPALLRENEATSRPTAHKPLLAIRRSSKSERKENQDIRRMIEKRRSTKHAVSYQLVLRVERVDGDASDRPIELVLGECVLVDVKDNHLRIVGARHEVVPIHVQAKRETGGKAKKKKREKPAIKSIECELLSIT
jgi:hypothetical protein